METVREEILRLHSTEKEDMLATHVRDRD